MNLLSETKDILKENNKSSEDVEFVMIGQDDYSESQPVYFSWEQFAEAANFQYDDGFGGCEIVLELKVVGKDFWLERREYDGSEWWEFKTLPEKPSISIVPTKRLLGGR